MALKFKDPFGSGTSKAFEARKTLRRLQKEEKERKRQHKEFLKLKRKR